MGRIAIFTDEPGWHGKQLVLAFSRLGYGGEFVSLTDCRLQLEDAQMPIRLPGFDETLPDAAFVRGVPGGSLEEVVFYLDILHALKVSGIPVYNDGRAVERSVDKAMTSFLLHRAGLPTPATWVVRERSAALSIAERELKAGRQLLSKPLFGSQGEGIRRIEKMTDLFWLTGSRGIYYLQRFVHCRGSRFCDTRVFVINGQVLTAMRRHGISWLNNVARGAACESVTPNRALRELAVQAVKTLQMDYAGVDIIEDRQGGYQIIEVNSIPAWKGLENVSGITIAEVLADDLVRRYLARFRSCVQADVS